VPLYVVSGIALNSLSGSKTVFKMKNPVRTSVNRTRVITRIKMRIGFSPLFQRSD
jgi:hypothetical protein